MKKKIILSSLIFVVIVSVIAGVIFTKKDMKKDVKVPDVEVKQLDKDKIPKKVEKESSKKDEKKATEVKENTQTSNTSNVSNNSNRVSSNNNTQIKNNTANNTTNQPVKEQPVQNNTNTQATTPKEVPIWEQLGMTQDRYENQPRSDWMRVDFKTMEECANYGDNYKPYLDGEVSYTCRDVTSLSGKYLGVMFDTTKLN